MTTFLDGPARRLLVLLRSAPAFLRAVVDRDGNVDVLDPKAKPLPDEKIVLYRYLGPRDRKRDPEFPRSSYQLNLDQPGEAIRKPSDWEAWTKANKAS